MKVGFSPCCGGTAPRLKPTLEPSDAALKRRSSTTVKRSQRAFYFVITPHAMRFPLGFLCCLVDLLIGVSLFAFLWMLIASLLGVRLFTFFLIAMPVAAGFRTAELTLLPLAYFN